MATLRQILDKRTTIDLQAYGTPEGVSKAWDTRGRSGNPAQQGEHAAKRDDRQRSLREKGLPHDEIQKELGMDKDEYNRTYNKPDYSKPGGPVGDARPKSQPSTLRERGRKNPWEYIAPR